jgi:hypothetical protein
MRNLKIDTFVLALRGGDITVGDLRQLSKQIGLADDTLGEALLSGSTAAAAMILGVDQEELNGAITASQEGVLSKQQFN